MTSYRRSDGSVCLAKWRLALSICLAGGLIGVAGAGAQWNMPKGIPGLGGGSAATGTPMGYLTDATIQFLKGSQKLSEAADRSDLASKYASTIANLEHKGEIEGDDLHVVDEAAGEIKKLADDEDAMAKADQRKVTEAAVHVGVATYLEKQAIDATQSGGVAGAVGRLGDTALFATTVPANLKSMLAAQTTLLGYLRRKGINPTGDVDRAIKDLEKR